MDKVINAIVAKDKPVQGQRGQYRVIRKSEDVPPRPRKRRRGDSGTLLAADDEEDTGADAPIEIPLTSTPIWPSSSQPNAIASGANDEVDEEEMSETNETQDEWQIRVGNTRPPLWGKPTGANTSKISSGVTQEYASIIFCSNYPLNVAQKSFNSATRDSGYC